MSKRRRTATRRLERLLAIRGHHLDFEALFAAIAALLHAQWRIRLFARQMKALTCLNLSCRLPMPQGSRCTGLDAPLSYCCCAPR